MFDYILPDMMHVFLIKLLKSFPYQAVPFVLSIFWCLYIIAIFNIIKKIYCRLDFLIAYYFRKIGLSPLEIQYAIGDFFESSPIIIKVFATVLITIGTTMTLLNINEPLQNGGWAKNLSSLMNYFFSILFGVST